MIRYFSSLLVIAFAALASVVISPAASAASILVYSSDFDGSDYLFGGVTASTSGATTASVQGYAGLGTVGNQFSGNMLTSYNSSGTGTLVLSNLPTHSSVDLHALLAIIDSWDSTNGSVSPDYLQIKIDGAVVFSDTYDNASGSINNTAGLADIGGGIQQRGFSSWGDQAFDFGSALTNIAHSSSTMTVQILGTGAGWQGGTDESWGMDNFSVTLNDVPENAVPAPGGVAALGLALIGLWAARRRIGKLV